MCKHRENVKRNKERQWKDSEGEHHVGILSFRSVWIGALGMWLLFIIAETLS